MTSDSNGEAQTDAVTTDNELALPRGFHDLEEESLERERVLLDSFAKRGRQIGCSLLRTSPMGYGRTLRRASNAAGDKVFTLPGGGPRELMLTPDSTPAVLRWYLSQRKLGPARVAFRSPLFRYRRQKYRHFQQMGFTFINEPYDRPGELDEVSLQLVRAALRVFVLDLGVSMTLNVTDFGAWRHCLNLVGLNNDRVGDVLHSLRPLRPDERKQWIEGKLPRADARHSLVWLSSYRATAEGTVTEGALGDLVRNARCFAHLAAVGFGVKAHIDFADLHSSELQDGIGFSFATEEGERFADGGCYGLYGRRFDARVRTLKSFASGVEFFLERDLLASTNIQSDKAGKVLIVELDAPRSYSRAIAESLLEYGLTVVCRRLEGKLRAFLHRQDGTFSWLIVVGQTERDSGLFRVRHMESGEMTVVRRQDLAEWLGRRVLADICVNTLCDSERRADTRLHQS